ncbi:MAG TPA: Gfo/Idh/MocA family oxidoreductase [Candidatus Omnitrophica bacterium]|nr:Gfo/Idh/MocA family oxidoreductase [Candidatus Omnitrophota bacterium]
MAKIKVGIIGAGGIAQYGHIEKFQQLPNSSLQAIADANVERAKEVAKRYNIPRFYADYRDMLKKEELNAVSICTPNFLHKQQAIDSFNSGCHVLCEKPVGLNAEEVEEMLKTAKQKNKILMAAMCWRYGAETQTLKKFIEEGKLGRIYYARVAYLRRAGTPEPGSWFTIKSKSGGGALIDLGVHMIDLAVWFMGFPEPVSAYGSTYQEVVKQGDRIGGWPPPATRINPEKITKKVFEVEEFASGLVKFANGATLSVEVSWAANLNPGHYLTFLGDKGGADLVPELKIYSQDGDIAIDTIPQGLPNVDRYLEEIREFLECVERGKQPGPSGEKILVVQKILDAIYRSAETSKEARITF